MQQIMKIVAIFLCLTLVLVCGAPCLREFHNECLVDLTNHLFRAVHAEGSSEKTNVDNHMLCLTTKYRIQNHDGSINRKAVRAVLAVHVTDEAKLEEFTNVCAEEGATPNETALKLSRCIVDSSRWGRHCHHENHHHGDYNKHKHSHDSHIGH